METILSLLAPIVELYGPQSAFVVKLVITIGSLRLFVKPLMSVVQAYILFTPSEKDDAWFAKFQDNKIYKAVVYCLDWFGSIKVKK